MKKNIQNPTDTEYSVGEMTEKELKLLKLATSKKVAKSSKKVEKKSSKKVEKKLSKKAEKKSNKKVGKKKDGRVGFGRQECKTGKFKSIRHLLETLFAKNKDLTKEEGDIAVKKHFPTSRWVTFDSQWGSYFTRIRSHGEFKTITAPKWAQGGAKIKKSNKK